MAARKHVVWSLSLAAAVVVVLALPRLASSLGSDPATARTPSTGNYGTRSTTAVAYPRIVYTEGARTRTPLRLHGATVGPQVTIGISRENLVRAVSFYVDQPASSKQAYAVDRTAPFVVPRKGASASSPYAVGPHSLRARVELRKGRTIGLQVAYTVARTLEIPATIDGETLSREIGSAGSGPLLVRPAAGASSFSVSGELQIARPSVAIEHAALSSTIEFRPQASGSSLEQSSALGFFIFGADDIVLEGNTFDGRGIRKDTIIWDEPAGNTPDNWVIRNNTFRNYYTSNPEDHSQAIYVGYSTNGLIEGNTFTNNGNTSHIFFTWFGNQADPATSYPRNICVRGNTFNETAGAYFDVNFRAEIPASANIKIQRNASNTDPEFYGAC